MGIASHTNVETVHDNGQSFSVGDKGMYQSLSIGAKITFPFSFTSEDGTNLLTFFLGLLDNRN
jgi:hypothetical protein